MLAAALAVSAKVHIVPVLHCYNFPAQDIVNKKQCIAMGGFVQYRLVGKRCVLFTEQANCDCDREYNSRIVTHYIYKGGFVFLNTSNILVLAVLRESTVSIPVKHA
jgi:hypothetical protein